MKNVIIFTVAFIGLLLLIPPALEAKASKKQYSGKINLNSATQDEIDQLPGISPKKAGLIVEYRKTHPFKKVEDLDEVKGFTPKSIDKLKPYVSVDGPNTLKVEGGKTKKDKKQVLAKKKEKKVKTS